MTFGEAVEALKGGGTVRRAEWPAAYGNAVSCKESEEFSDPLFFMELTNGMVNPWSPSHRDIIADDWETVA
jgi:hypothetical protein